MTSVTIRFHGVQEQILERILESGIAETVAWYREHGA